MWVETWYIRFVKKTDVNASYKYFTVAGQLLHFKIHDRLGQKWELSNRLDKFFK